MRGWWIAAALTLGCGASHPPAITPEAPPDAGPPPDPDHDGFADAYDVCPCEAEDADGFEDGDGCPEPDNDHDRIVDACDQCPNDPETYNGTCDGDSCPDHGYVCIEESRIVIVEYVRFARNASTWSPASTPIVDAIAATMNGNPQITLVAVIGEADPHEGHRPELAQARAEAVLEALVARGVDRARLVAEADPAPVHPDDDPPEAWRRVRLEIRTIRGEPVDTAPAVDPGGGCGDVYPRECETSVCTPPPPVPPAC